MELEERLTWTDSALKVLKERYLIKREDGEYETPDEMCWRVARAVAEAERNYGSSEDEVAAVAAEFARAMMRRDFMPNSPALMNAGTGNGLGYMACLVLPIEDSMEGIFDTLKHTALVHKAGGGTGFSFQRLRPRNTLVQSTNGYASGPVSFMRVYDAATGAVIQGGSRRGASLGVLEVSHPDIMEFINCKTDGGITNFNISVAITDEFMVALDDGADFALTHNGKEYKRVPAIDVWNAIVDCAWKTGDPGLMFIDTVNNGTSNPTPKLCRLESPNACGELNLFPYEPCVLASINLGNFVENHSVMMDELQCTAASVVRFLDNMFDVNPYPLPQIEKVAKQYRRIGMGVMGWADMLFKMGIPYDTYDALQLAENVMACINKAGHEASRELAVKRGPFPLFPDSIYADGIPMRNAGITTIPPTGTTSIIAGASSGIEPLFALAYVHDNQLGRQLHYINNMFIEKAQESGVYSPALVEHVTKHGMLTGFNGLPDDFRRVFVTAHEIEPEWHVKMQAAFQKHVDASISKSVNLSHTATADDIARVYRLAYDLGCKGVTVFRDGCKGAQVLNIGKKEAKPEGKAEVKKRAKALQGTTYKTETPLGTAYVTVNNGDDGEPFELFCNIGRAGSDIAAVSEAMSRLISLVLRVPSNMPTKERLKRVGDQLLGIGGGRSLGFGVNRVKSLPDAVAQVIIEHLDAHVDKPSVDLCPECGHAALAYEEGCLKCHGCGYSEC